MREAGGFGADVIIPTDGVPYCSKKLIQNLGDISKLKVIDPSSNERMNDRLEAVRLLKSHVQKDAPVVGWVEGPVAESCDLMGISECLCEMLDEPEAIHELLSICLEQASVFAIEQLKAGADIIGVGDAACSLIGPELYEKFSLPYQQKLISNIHKAGGKVKLHICGNTNPILHLMAQTGADIIDLDHMVDMKKACEVFPESRCINGNFDPVKILLQGTEETVEHAVRSCLDYAALNRTFIAAGCEVPILTPEKNLKAVTATLTRFSQNFL
jgi:MtaA/CmuA family methyltransferase